MKKKSVLSLVFATLIGVGTVLPNGHIVSAKSLSELEQEKENIQNQKDSVHEDISVKEGEIDKLISEERNLADELAQLEKEIGQTNDKIAGKQKEIDQTKDEIEKLKKEIKELETKIQKRTELLEKRARNLQANGGSVKYIDVLLGSSSFSDFIDRFTAVNTLVQADQEIVEEQERDKEKLEETKTEVETKLDTLNKMLDELETLKADLDKKNKEKAALKKEVEAERTHVESMKMSLEEEAEILAAQEEIINSAITEEEARLAEEARKAQEAARKAEEARQAEEARKAAKAKESTTSNSGASSSSNQTTSSNSSTTNSGNNVASKPTAPSAPSASTGGSGKKLSYWPTSGRVSSGFGPRWNSQHGGIDIANSAGTPIYAAEDGIVTVSHFSDSYGNVVYVYHPSKNLTTVYAHMSSRSVKAGDRVTGGQLVGKMGSTGWSTGNHLHFEVHEGQWSHANRRNPYNYY